MGARYHVRDYAPDDAAGLAQLLRDSVTTLGVRDYSAEQVSAWAGRLPDAATLAARCGDGRRVWVAQSVADDGLLGFTDLESDGHIDMLYVAPGAKGSGVADALTDALIAAAVKAGLARIHVEASEAARRFYMRRGFIERGRRDRMIGDTAIHNFAMELLF